MIQVNAKKEKESVDNTSHIGEFGLHNYFAKCRFSETFDEIYKIILHHILH